MLRKEDFVYYGKFLKPHGTKGEIGLLGDSMTLGEDCDYVAADIDGILVPFFFEYTREKKSDTLIVKIERIDSTEQARLLTNREVYIPREWAEEGDSYTWGYFRGFTTADEQLGELGEIIDVDDSTINTLFIVEHKGEELLIPAQEEFIEAIDHDGRRILFNIPEGLISL